MRKALMTTSLLLAACTHTEVDVGNGNLTTTDAGGASDVADVRTRFTGNAPSCPASPPEFADICNVDEWQSCAYQWNENGSGNYVGCTCFEQNSSVKRWDCTRTGGDVYGCPFEEPVTGTPCRSGGTFSCSYPPRAGCSCDLNDLDAKWKCEDTSSIPTQAKAGPASVPESKTVSQLTDAEAATWCTWLLNIDGPRANPPEGPISAQGYATNLGSRMNPRFFAEVCMPLVIPISYCVANLKLAPCEATVAEMNDCALTMAKDIPYLHGCGRFTARAHCEETIFHPLHSLVDAGAGCDTIRVR
jgi:hypothetical protein